MMEPVEKIRLACSIMRQFQEQNPIQIYYPFENQLIDNADDNSLVRLYNELMSENYLPSKATIIDSPKSRGLIRHLSYLTVKDHLLYILLAIDLFPALYNKIIKNNSDSASDVLKSYPKDSSWMKVHIKGDLMEKRQHLFDKGFNIVLNSDISAFGPNIDIDTICCELLDSGAHPETVNKLRLCLRCWSPLHHKGLPQVHFTSDLLAELYLNPVDLYFMSFESTVYLRESDNIEIWCKTESSCKQMLTHLSRILFERGLYLNNEKTVILKEKSIDRNEHPLEHKKYGWFNSFKERFSKGMNIYYRIQQTIFVNDCCNRLRKNPEFTIALLEHYSNEKIPIQQSLLKFLASDNAIYPHQNYLIIKWLYLYYNPKEKLSFQILREIAWEENNPYYLKSISRYFIYKFGNDNDREKIRLRSQESHDQLEQNDMQFLAVQSLEYSF